MRADQVRARIETLLRASPSPESAALLSRMPRPRCGTPGCAGKLSRNTGKCGRCGAAKVADRYRRADGTHFDRERGDRRSIPQTIQPGTAVVAEQAFRVEAREISAYRRHVNTVLAATKTESSTSVENALTPAAVERS